MGRLRALFSRKRLDRELDEELAYHLERQAAANESYGMPPGEAKYAALRAMDNITAQKEAARAARGTAWLEHAGRDVLHALRLFRRAPGFAAAVVLTLGLGIGANVAVFTVVNGVVFRPLPYHDPSRLVVLEYQNSGTVAGGTFLDWRAGMTSLEAAGAAEWWSPNLGGAEPEQVTALRLSAEVLPMLGVQPMLGRVFTGAEAEGGGARVVVLGHGAWQTRFGADSNVIGRVVTLDGESHTVVGVMPEGFRFAPYWATRAELWAPLALEGRRDDRRGASLRAFARLRRGVSIEQARADLAAVAARLEQEYPGTSQNTTITPLHEKVAGPVRPALMVLLAAVVMVLLIACANVAHLQLIRAAARERESAVRAALGASRRRLLQQSLIESLLLSLAGTALAVLLSQLGVKLLLALGPPLPRLEAVTMDGRVFVFLAVACLASAFIFGLAPALRGSGVPLTESLKEGSRGGSDSARQRRLRGALVVSEFTVAVVLLVAAGLVIRSFAARLGLETGFDPRGVLGVRVSLRGSAHEPRELRAGFFRDLTARAAALPGVEGVSAINHLPLAGDNWRFPFVIEGREPPAPGDEPRALFRIVRPGYFGVMRIPVSRGREFGAVDEEPGTRTVIVNEAFARLHWPGADPIGRRITVEPGRDDWFTIVGVSANVRQAGWVETPEPEMYFPYVYEPSTGGVTLMESLSPSSMTLVLRTAGDPAALSGQVTRLIASLDGSATPSEITTISEAIEGQLGGPRFYVVLLGVFAALALVLAAVGVYGVISYSTARRAREIGVRLALGAQRIDAVRLVLVQGLRLALIGQAIGFLIALALSRHLRVLLFGVGSRDLPTFALVGVVLTLVAAAACWFPARRASRIDPLAALRSE